MDRITLIVTTRTRPGKRDEVLSLYKEMLAPRALENDAQQLVVWSADQHDPDTFYLFEIYADGAAMGANAQAPWFADYLARVGPLLAGEPKVSMATPTWAKGI